MQGQPSPLRRGAAALLLGLASALAAAAAYARPPLASLEAMLPRDLRPLAIELSRLGFRLTLAVPPAAGVYGQFVPASRTLFLAPITLELGIARQTLLHEAVHAAQSCPGGTLTPIGWNLRLNPLIAQEISGILAQRYPLHNHLLEREAFAMQGQSDAVGRIVEALRRRCRSPR